jgi:hypothetical protein
MTSPGSESYWKKKIRNSSTNLRESLDKYNVAHNEREKRPKLSVEDSSIPFSDNLNTDLFDTNVDNNDTDNEIEISVDDDLDSYTEEVQIPLLSEEDDSEEFNSQIKHNNGNTRSPDLSDYKYQAPIYTNAQLTLLQMIILFIRFIIRHNLNQVHSPNSSFDF